MLGYASSPAARAYANVGLETGVASGSPHRLITMLFEGALLQVARARAAIGAGNVEMKGTAISKAIQIIEEGLKASLDRRGGELGENLAALYDYMGRRLLLASLKSDVGVLDEVTRLLSELKDAWESIAPANQG